MMSQVTHRKLTELRFVGGRFDELDGLVEFDFLGELVTYRDLLVGIAEETWRRANPDRKNLPPGFKKGIRLAFRDIHPGSVIIPIERVFELDLPLEPPKDEIDEAAIIIEQTLRAAERDEPFPRGLSQRIVPLFGEWGITLQEGEGIELGGNGAGGRARLNVKIRTRILARAARKYQDRVTISGEVRGASLLRTSEGGSFVVNLDDGTRVEGSFAPEQEATITEALYRHRDVRIRIEGTAQFDPDGRMRRLVAIDRITPAPLCEDRYDPRSRPIWEVAIELGQSVPEEEWDKIPRDAARNLDHYIYGTPKGKP